MANPLSDRGLDVPALRDALEEAVTEAGAAILEVRGRRTVRVGMKGLDGPVTEADHAADDVLHRRLMPLINGVHWLSEESEQSAPLIHGEPTWVVDPLDGTREFLMGLPEFAVSVGLFVEDRLALGAVWLPVADERGEVRGGSVLSGIVGDASGPGEARHDRRELTVLGDRPGEGRVALSRWDYERRGLQHHLNMPAYPCGSSAVKLAHVAQGAATVYLSTGPRSVWDVAGGAAILLAAGGELTRAEGTALSLSPQQVRIPPFAAGRRERSLSLLRDLGAGV